jgi:predicted CoA-binding protein
MLHLPVAVNAAGEKLSKQTLALALDCGAARCRPACGAGFLGQQPPADLARGTVRRTLGLGCSELAPGTGAARAGDRARRDGIIGSPRRFTMLVDDVAGLRRVLQGNRVIAVVGLSPSWNRPSYFAAKYMLEHGYTVIPVNPPRPRSSARRAIPTSPPFPVKVDMVDVFRKPEDALPIADEAVRIGARCLWLQLGVINPRRRRNSPPRPASTW